MTDKKYSKIKRKIKQIKSQYTRKTIDPIRNIFAINSLGGFIVVLIMFYICISGIISLFFTEGNFSFMRETMRILECILISIISYFFGGYFNNDEDENQK